MKHFSRLFVSVLLAGILFPTFCLTASAGVGAPPPIDSSLAGSDQYQRQQVADSPASSSASSSSNPSSLTSKKFMFNPNDLSPTEENYEDGDKEGTPDGNTMWLLRRVAKILLVVVSTGAVLFITYGGFLMAISGGDADRSTKGRTIITYNVQALIVAMLAYGIVQFVIWIIWGTN